MDLTERMTTALERIASALERIAPAPGEVPDWSLAKIYRGMMEFMILQCIGLIIVLMYPDLVLWLPRVLFGMR